MDWRIYQVTVMGAVSLCSITYLADGAPFPRPLYVFVGAGVALATLFLSVQDVNNGPGALEEGMVYLSATVVALFLRLTQWVRTIVAGSDMIAHYGSRTGYIVDTGHVDPTLGMYSHAPFLHILVAINKLVTALQIYDVRLVAVAFSAVIPVIVAVVGRRVGGRRTGIYTLLLAVSFPLFFRVGATFDSESIAIPLFATMLFLLYCDKFSRSRRFTALLLGLMIVSAWVHFLYPIVIVGTVLGGMWVAEVIARLPDSRSTLNDWPRTPVFAAAVIFGFILFRILMSDIGAQMFVGLGVTGAEVGSSSSLLDISIIPSGGSVGETIGGGGGSGNRLLNIVLPLGAFGTLAAIGGLRALYDRTDRNVVILSVTAILGIGVLVGLAAYASRSSFRLGYRLYYFAGIVGLIFAALALVWLREFVVPALDTVHPAVGRGMLVVLVAVVFTFGTLAPASSLGNAVDPQFGGSSLAVTDMEYEQLSSLSEKLNEKLHRLRAPGLEFPAGADDRTGLPAHEYDPKQETPVITTADDSCLEHDSVWVTDRYRLCS